MMSALRRCGVAVVAAVVGVVGVVGVALPVEARPPLLVAPERLANTRSALDPDRCPRWARLAVVDRQAQRGWLCEGMRVVREFPVTTAKDQPDPGWYRVYARDIRAWSTIDTAPVTMTHFVAFTRGKYEGARVAFHSVPLYRDGVWAQTPDSVGSMDSFGNSAGCIRTLPDDAQAIWDHLRLGDWVIIAS